MLKVNNIEVVYSDIILVLRGISIEVPDGEIIAFLGSNGAGKSTTLKAISCILKYQDGEVTKGSIEFEGEEIHYLDPFEVVKRGITMVPEGRRIFREMTVEENIRVGAYIREDIEGISGDMKMVMDFFPVLQHRRRQIAGYLSGGEQQMLAIARALMARPKLMMLDEPSLGLAPIVIKAIFEIIKRINQEGKVSILLVEQNANIALANSHYGYIMENGKIVMDGPSQKLKENEDVREFYLGLTEEAKKRRFSDVKHYKRRKRWLS
ncbi:MAG: ABC transporter ATP-binding protein [Candidatus Bathyarchaeia archaeon]